MKFILTSLLLLLPNTYATDDLKIENYRGKVVYIDFWASWCAPCKESFPWLNEVQKKYQAQGLVVIGVNVDREKAKADEFLKTTPAQFPIVYNPDGSMPKKFGVQGMPYAVIIDKTGKTIHTHIGFRGDKTKEYEHIIEGALK
jgi:thiol-disulfide isomerase/thioredoxin